MVKHASKTHSLLLATAQHILPLLASIPAALAVREVSQASFLQDALQVVLRLSLLTHIMVAVRVDDLVTEGTDAEIWPLWQEHDAVLANILGSTNQSTVDGPKSGENTGNGRLANTVGAGDLIVLGLS